MCALGNGAVVVAINLSSPSRKNRVERCSKIIRKVKARAKAKLDPQEGKRNCPAGPSQSANG